LNTSIDGNDAEDSNVAVVVSPYTSNRMVPSSFSEVLIDVPSKWLFRRWLKPS